MGFWAKEHCEHCDGVIIEKTVDLPRRAGKKYVLIKNVPIGVCKQCNMRYYAANVLKGIETIVHGHQKAERKISMDVYSLAGK